MASKRNRFTLETKYKIIQDRIKGKWNEEIVKIYRLKDSSNVSRICQQQKEIVAKFECGIGNFKIKSLKG